MVVFINDYVFEYGYPVSTKVDKKTTRLCIMNITDPQKDKLELTEIVLPFNIKSNHIFKCTSCFQCSNLTVVDENEYIFQKDGSTSDDNIIYALIRAPKFAEPSEIYVPIEDKDKITILKQFNFYGYSSSNATFLDKMYFLKIISPVDETVSLYFSTAQTKFFTSYTVLFNSKLLGLRAKKYNFYTNLSETAHKKYIALSDL